MAALSPLFLCPKNRFAKAVQLPALSIQPLRRRMTAELRRRWPRGLLEGPFLLLMGGERRQARPHSNGRRCSGGYIGSARPFYSGAEAVENILLLSLRGAAPFNCVPMAAIKAGPAPPVLLAPEASHHSLLTAHHSPRAIHHAPQTRAHTRFSDKRSKVYNMSSTWDGTYLDYRSPVIQSY